MRLMVRHTTVYDYDLPMRFVCQNDRATPAPNAGQKVLAWSVSSEGARFGARFTDGGGDLISTMTVHGPVERVEIHIEGEVETADTAGILRGHREIVSPRVYLQPTAAIAINKALRDLGRSVSVEPDEGTLGLAHALSAQVADTIAYKPGTTKGATTAAEALEIGSGVCQDMAHVLIALAQEAAIPARYVTGYLLTSDDTLGEATHAWAELFIDGLGWVGFDPANRCCPDERYIRLGSGRDAGEAAPIRGVSRGGGAEGMDVSVLVAAQQ